VTFFRERKELLVESVFLLTEKFFKVWGNFSKQKGVLLLVACVESWFVGLFFFFFFFYLFFLFFFFFFFFFLLMLFFFFLFLFFFFFFSGFFFFFFFFFFFCFFSNIIVVECPLTLLNKRIGAHLPLLF